jgi:hypothetical protein
VVWLYFMPCFGIQVFCLSVRYSWPSKPHLRHCSPIPNPTHLPPLYMTSLKSYQARVWIRSGPMERHRRQTSRPRQRIGRQHRLRLRAVLVSLFLRSWKFEPDSVAPETADDYTAFLRELGIGGQEGLAVPTNPFADSLWDLAVFSPGVTIPNLL